MSFGSNNSRNIANLLRYQPLQPIQPRRNINLSQPQPIIPSNQRPREQIPIEDVFTPDDTLQRRNYKRRTPMSSGNGGDGPLRATNREQDMQLEGLKVRLDQVIKFYDERHNKLQTKFSVRLNELQNFVMKEVPKVDNANMISADLVSCKQAIKQLRRHNDQQAQQLATLKVIGEQRVAKDALAVDPKQKQKMTVLFMEMVRLGDTVEKMQSGMNSVNRNYEGKNQQQQYKLANIQKNIALMSQRNVNGNQVLSEFGDKVMDRLQTAQNNLAILGKERIKDKQTINQLIIQNERIGEDVQGLVKNIQGQFSNKLQNRISETVSRLMYEHEERINAQEQIKKNLDMRQRMNLQKQNSDKQQIKNRYENMDALVRTQFLKKQESIRGLHALMEQQMRNFQKEMLNEGSKRKQTQNLLRGQIKRVQQSFKRQYDIYKAHQSDLVEKIGGIVNEEVQVRINSQLNLKKLTSDVADIIVTDLNGVKEALSNTTKKLNLSIKQVANQSSERSGQLSHYVDQEVKKVVDVVTEKYSKMKNVFTKLAQQLRNHLLNTETNRKNVQARLTSIEQDFDKMKGQVTEEIEQFYTDLEERLKEEKEYVETEVFKKNNDLSIRVNKLQQYTNQYFQLLKSNIEDNKQILNKKVSNINEQKSPQSEEQLKELRTIVFNIRGITQQLKVQSRQSIEDMRRQIKQKTGEVRREALEKQTQTNQKIAKNGKSIKELQDNVNQLTVKVNSLRTEAASEGPISNDRLKKLSDEIDDVNVKVRKVEEKGNDDHRDNEKQIIKLRSDINVLKGQVGALDDDIKKLSS